MSKYRKRSSQAQGGYSNDRFEKVEIEIPILGVAQTSYAGAAFFDITSLDSNATSKSIWARDRYAQLAVLYNNVEVYSMTIAVAPSFLMANSGIACGGPNIGFVIGKPLDYDAQIANVSIVSPAAVSNMMYSVQGSAVGGITRASINKSRKLREAGSERAVPCPTAGQNADVFAQSQALTGYVSFSVYGTDAVITGYQFATANCTYVLKFSGKKVSNLAQMRQELRLHLMYNLEDMLGQSQQPFVYTGEPGNARRKALLVHLYTHGPLTDLRDEGIVDFHKGQIKSLR